MRSCVVRNIIRIDFILKALSFEAREIWRLRVEITRWKGTSALLRVVYAIFALVIIGCAHCPLPVREQPPKGYQFVAYRVKPGDTLVCIGREHGISAESIAAINAIADQNRIQVNQRIWVPKRKFSILSPFRKSGEFVRVSKDETIMSLSRKFGSDASEIVSYNRIQNADYIVPGRLLFLPGGSYERVVVREEKKKPVTKRVAAPKPSMGTGQLGWPVDIGKFKITSRFGERHSRPHTGLDLAAPCGTTIRAAKDGIVIVASENLRGYGKTVVLLHEGGLKTIYAHASRICVKSGQKIRKGEKIAEVGSTGRSTGYHLHFEVREKTEKPIDPMLFLSPLN